MSTDRIQAIRDGFHVIRMSIGDAETGKVLWKSGNLKNSFNAEMRVELPKEVLQLHTVSREMEFHSKEEMKNFRVVQGVYLHGNAIEEWRFKFGFVIPNSQNTWQCMVESAGDDKMIPAEVLSGNLTIESRFFDGEELVGEAHARIYYV